MARISSWMAWMKLSVCDGFVVKVMEDSLICSMYCCMYVHCGVYQIPYYRTTVNCYSSLFVQLI